MNEQLTNEDIATINKAAEKLARKLIAKRPKKASCKVRRQAAEKSLGLAISYIHTNHPGILQDFADAIEVAVETSSDDSEETSY